MGTLPYSILDVVRETEAKSHLVFRDFSKALYI